MNDTQIEAATAQDCRAIAEIHVESWQHAYKDLLPDSYLRSLSVAEREAMWHRMAMQQASALLVARRASQVLGFISFGASRDEDAPAGRAEIWAIYVQPADWSTGVGRALLLRAIDRLFAEGYASISLWVIVGNARAMRFYECAGFVCEADSRKSFELGGTMLEELRYILHRS